MHVHVERGQRRVAQRQPGPRVYSDEEKREDKGREQKEAMVKQCADEGRRWPAVPVCCCCCCWPRFQTRSSSVLYSVGWRDARSREAWARGSKREIPNGLERDMKTVRQEMVVVVVCRENGGNLSVTRWASGNERQATSMCYIKSFVSPSPCPSPSVLYTAPPPTTLFPLLCIRPIAKPTTRPMYNASQKSFTATKRCGSMYIYNMYLCTCICASLTCVSPLHSPLSLFVSCSLFRRHFHLSIVHSRCFLYYI